MSVETLQQQQVQLNSQLAELKNELAGLQNAQADVMRQRNDFQSQLDRRRASVRKLSNVANSRIVAKLANRRNDAINYQFQNNVNSCYDGFLRQISSAIDDVRAEIRACSNSIADVEDDIADEKRREELLKQQEQSA